MSHQHQHNSSGSLQPGAEVLSALRSQTTKPSPKHGRSPSNPRGANAAPSGNSSSIARQGSAGQLGAVGAVRRASLSSSSSAATGSRHSSAAVTQGQQQHSSASASAANGTSVLAARHHQIGSSATAVAAAAPPQPAADALTPVPAPGARTSIHNNSLYRDVDGSAGLTPAGMTSGGGAGPVDAAAANGSSSAFRTSRITSRSSGGASAALLQLKPPKPQHYLRTTGDLFNPPDQDYAQEPCVVGVTASTQLVSPGWNQHRPWLTGSWLMQRPAEFMQEASSASAAAGGGSSSAAGSEQQQQGLLLPPLRDLCEVDGQMAEALLVDDLLTVMMGQAGQYIKHSLVEGDVYPRLGLWVQGVPDPSLQEQVERLLPLCECVFVIKRFVETRAQIQYPMVAQALAAAMRKLQEEWWVLVVQLEHQCRLGQLNLAALLYYCQAPAASLALLASIAGEAAAKVELTSAGLLNLLVSRQRSLAGDRAGQALVGVLLEAAAEPYFGILRQWMCSGVLDDPYGEFMVKEDRDVCLDSLTPEGEAAYWVLRYTIRRGVTEEFDVPVFLGSSADAILVTGKYLNVIRACNQPVPPCPPDTSTLLRYDAAAAERGSPPFLAGIQAALSAAAGALLQHMTGPRGRLLSWLHCLKHFFLLDQGDFLVHLMEAGEAESHGHNNSNTSNNTSSSSTPLSGLAPHQLQGLLDAALRSSSLAASPHVDVLLGVGAEGYSSGESAAGAGGVLAVKADTRSILQLVTAATVSGGQQDVSLRAAADNTSTSGSSSWEHMMLTLKTAWPLNLVVARRQLLHYQVIFKQLLGLKQAERQLGYVWQALRATKRLGKDDQARFRPWHHLCSQLQHVVGEVLRYTSIDVLEPLWADMYGRLLTAGNMDEVIQLHNAFLSAALERSLLLQAEVVRHVHNLLAAAKELSKVAESCDVRQTSGSSSGGGAAAPASAGSQKQRASAAQHHLQVLSMFCRQATRQEQLAQLQQKVDRELRLLVERLEGHKQQLSQASLGTTNGAASSFRGGSGSGGSVGSGLQQWRWGHGSMAAAVGDSSRELASLHNLIQRLELGEPSVESKMQGGSR